MTGRVHMGAGYWLAVTAALAALPVLAWCGWALGG